MIRAIIKMENIGTKVATRCVILKVEAGDLIIEVLVFARIEKS